jgi:hypothetical protein
LRVRLVLSAAVLACGLPLFYQPAQAVRQDTASVTESVQYQCTSTDGAGQSQNISVRVVLTMPTGAVPDQQMEIGWQGSYEGPGLVAPATGLAAGTKLYAYAGISDFPNLTSATGVGELTTIGAGATIPLPDSVTLRTTAHAAGTGTARPGAINFGTSPTAPSIKCEVQNREALTTYTLTVGGSSTTSSPEPTETATDTEDPVTETERPAYGGSVTKTPVGGAVTGGGGEVGPDGRSLLIIGSLLVLAAGTGLLLRRHAVS